MQGEQILQAIQAAITSGSRLSIVGEQFLIQAFELLQKELKNVEQLQFLFTSPTFVPNGKEIIKREFDLLVHANSENLFGTEYEMKLRTQLGQKALARACSEWIRQKAMFRSNISGSRIPNGFIYVENAGKNTRSCHLFTPVQGFTPTSLGCDSANNLFSPYVHTIDDASEKKLRIDQFNELWNNTSYTRDVTKEVIGGLNVAFQENAPEFIYFQALYHLFNDLSILDDTSLPNEATGYKNSKVWNKLYDFQSDAVQAIISKLEKYNACILADSVGLGKTFSALAVIKYYENRNQRVLVLCPRKLSDNWRQYRENYVNNMLSEDHFRYDVFYHTDLDRQSGYSGDVDLSKMNWSNYDLIVIDESHNFRNGSHNNLPEGRENRYQKLLSKVLRPGVRTRVLMLSATPVNTQFSDLKNQIKLAYNDNPEKVNSQLPEPKELEKTFQKAQRAAKQWAYLPLEERTPIALLERLDFDFFELLENVTIARSRRHIEKFYDMNAIGKFPTRLPPISVQPELITGDGQKANYWEITESLMKRSYAVYTPSNFIHPSKKYKYEAELVNISHEGREKGIKRFIAMMLLKRLESCTDSFRLTLERILELHEKTIYIIRTFIENSRKKGTSAEPFVIESSVPKDLDYDEEFIDVGKMKINLMDMDYLTWLDQLEQDVKVFRGVYETMGKITSELDAKLNKLFDLIRSKMRNPINSGNRKILIFTAFADTAEYLYTHVSAMVKREFGLNTAIVTGSKGKTTLKSLKNPDLSTILTFFSPVSKEREILRPGSEEEIDILIATDCISEGQNLQDCDYLINYDIHWNPVRIIQRFGRIDRIGSKNEKIQLVNFWPDMELESYIKLKTRVENRMVYTNITATADRSDNLLDPNETEEELHERKYLEYRGKQLQRLRDEVVDLEDMNSGISITDIGLNDFRFDLLEYLRNHHDLKSAPLGMHAVANKRDETSGYIFVLKNVNEEINLDRRNRIHPFYMVYISENGEIVWNYLQPKQILDTFRLLCRDQKEAIPALYQQFNEQTHNGRNMKEVSRLLNTAVQSIIHDKEERDVNSLFRPGGTTTFGAGISGIEDFRLLCFLVIK